MELFYNKILFLHSYPTKKRDNGSSVLVLEEKKYTKLARFYSRITHIPYL